MNKEIIDMLICPSSGKSLDLIEIEQGSDNNIQTGFLYTEDGMIYPILRGVPRLIEGSMTLFEKDVKIYKEVLKEIDVNPESYLMSDLFKEQYLPTLKQFEKEWSSHSLDGKTWGWDQKDRINKYLDYMGIEMDDYNSSIFLDLGAGTGQFTCTLASELNCHAIGVDLSPAIEAGEKIRKEKFPDSKVNFIQANLMALPFKKEVFNYVHASGVLHHTPNTKKAFDAVESLVKPKGKYGVWIYRKTQTLIPLLPFLKSRKTQISADALRPYTSKMNPKMLYAIIYLYSAWFHIFYKANEVLRGKKHDQSISERTTSLFDTLAPSYVHKHDVSEVKTWFEQMNYASLIETDQDNVSGFNITGVKQG